MKMWAKRLISLGTSFHLSQAQVRVSATLPSKVQVTFNWELSLPWDIRTTICPQILMRPEWVTLTITFTKHLTITVGYNLPLNCAVHYITWPTVGTLHSMWWLITCCNVLRPCKAVIPTDIFFKQPKFHGLAFFSDPAVRCEISTGTGTQGGIQHLMK